MKRDLGVLTVLLSAVILSGCSVPAPAPGASTTTSSSTQPSEAPAAVEPPAPGSEAPAVVPAPEAVGDAAGTLATLPVKGRAPKTGYSRDQFGAAWEDVDGNGCDTRNDILGAQLSDVVRKGDGCTVLTGVLDDTYSGTVILFARDGAPGAADTDGDGVPGSSMDVQIDHVTALSEAWQKGAQQISAQERLALANDPLNLVATEGRLNSQKGDGDAATWLPPNKGVRCAYVARQVAVKAKYRLWVTQAEHDAIAGILSGCPGEPLPTGGLVAGAGSPTPDPIPSAEASPAVEAPSGQDQQFGSCSDAKAAGLGPYTAGTDPEYAWYKDGDGDGITCE